MARFDSTQLNGNINLFFCDKGLIFSGMRGILCYQRRKESSKLNFTIKSFVKYALCNTICLLCNILN